MSGARLLGVELFVYIFDHLHKFKNMYQIWVIFLPKVGFKQQWPSSIKRLDWTPELDHKSGIVFVSFFGNIHTHWFGLCIVTQDGIFP